MSGHAYSLIGLPTPYISKGQVWVILNLCGEAQKTWEPQSQAVLRTSAYNADKLYETFQLYQHAIIYIYIYTHIYIYIYLFILNSLAEKFILGSEMHVKVSI